MATEALTRDPRSTVIDGTSLSDVVTNFRAGDRGYQPRFSKDQVQHIVALIAGIGWFTGKDPRAIRREARIRDIGAKAAALAEQLKNEIAPFAGVINAPEEFRLGCQDPYGLIRELEQMSSFVERRPRSRRARAWEGAETSAGRRKDPSISLLVNSLARTYLQAGGRVVAKEDSDFAYFLGDLSLFLPEFLVQHTKRGNKRTWFMRWARQVDRRYRGVLGQDK